MDALKPVMKQIEVIAYFTSEGKLKPIRFRLSDTDDSLQVIRVDKVLYHNEERLGDNMYISFRCQSMVQGVRKDFELLFNKTNCKWTLMKY